MLALYGLSTVHAPVVYRRYRFVGVIRTTPPPCSVETKLWHLLTDCSAPPQTPRNSSCPILSFSCRFATVKRTQHAETRHNKTSNNIQHIVEQNTRSCKFWNANNVLMPWCLPYNRRTETHKLLVQAYTSFLKRKSVSNWCVQNMWPRNIYDALYAAHCMCCTQHCRSYVSVFTSHSVEMQRHLACNTDGW